MCIQTKASINRILIRLKVGGVGAGWGRWVRREFRVTCVVFARSELHHAPPHLRAMNPIISKISTTFSRSKTPPLASPRLDSLLWSFSFNFPYLCK